MRTLAAVLCCMCAASPIAQDVPRPTFRTDANYVRVDVYPTRDGAPVTDLQKDDFEVFEDKAPQKVDQFEHVVIRSVRAQDSGREPNTVAESRQAAQDPRARVFVLFLDINHVDAAASRTIRKPLVDALNRLIGPDDLIAVMTPEMSAREITFARRTTTIDGLLSRHWWGERDRLHQKDPVEEQYARCYPGIGASAGAPSSDQGIAQEMILRRRERQTLDALEGLVVGLRGLREERKAIVTITNGWRLYQPSPALARPVDGVTPPTPTIGVNPRDGRLTTSDIRNPQAAGQNDCERDRLALSLLDDFARFRDLLDGANRANASFYPIDPRGLAVFDEPIVPAAGVGVGSAANPTLSPTADRGRLEARNNSLRTLAEATDGVAVVQTNDLARGLKRIVDDLSSYYLLGYYSTGKLDGKFHSIAVRVKRQGVEVRARRGYLAPTPAEAAALTSAAAGIAPSVPAANADVQTAVGALAAIGRDRPVRVHAAAGWTPAGSAVVSAVAEVGRGPDSDDWTGGGQADAVLEDSSGASVATDTTPITPGSSSVRLTFRPGSLTSGSYQLRIRTKGTGMPAAFNETVSLSLPPAPAAAGAIFIRRGPTTGNKDVPTADVRFRRSDRLRVEVLASMTASGPVRLLDRAGKPLAVPVAGSVRDDADGSRWRTAELALAPLAPGDYIIELADGAGGAGRMLVAFRVVP